MITQNDLKKWMSERSEENRYIEAALVYINALEKEVSSQIAKIAHMVDENQKKIDGDLISRSALIKRLEGVLGMAENEPIQTYANAIRLAIGEAKLAPTIDAEPVRHGKWIYSKHACGYYDSGYTCSECRESSHEKLKSCPRCHARMDDLVKTED